MTKAARRSPAPWVRWTLAGVLAVLASAWFGVTTAGANLSLGPHEARYQVTTSGEVVADLGPLGTMRIDSPAGPLGVDVTIREIPADLFQIDQATTLDGLSDDLQSYLQFFSTPDVTIREVTHALVVDAVRRTVVALVVVAAVGGGLWFLVGEARRREIARVVAPRTWEITAAVCVVALLGGTLSADDRDTPQNAPVSPVFAGTALEGARLTGRLAGVIDTYGAQLLGIYRDNEKFYADARAALRTEWDRQAGVDQRIALAAASQGTAGLAGHDLTAPEEPSPGDAATPDAATPDAATPDAATPDGAATAEATPAATPVAADREETEDDLVTFLVVSDLHCNMSMTPLIRDIAERSGAKAILDAGDTTMNGTAVERVCVDSFATARPKGVDYVVSDGNHDSTLVSDAQRAQGLTVLDGSVVDVAGVRILGDRDPNETRVGAGTSSRGETLDEAAQRLADTACAEDPDLLLVHTPAVGDTTLRAGCVPFQVSGHTHRRRDPSDVGLGLRYVNGSTAGALSGQPTVGPLHGIAEMTLLRFDPVERRFVDWKLVEVFPDTTAKVSPWQMMPLPAQPADECANLPEGIDREDCNLQHDGAEGEPVETP
ncbi:metallophosphoesterase [Xylanimonas protaetiae]|uniref:Metallophosphoesterase n=1 Tax=Xylanimonas protaetiae TaxID=2509457 RepID=A0A4P6F6B7_9MICO|nr:metallophosphoesterase [Xylanimonas protaetiae]QAY71520.1 metallophosphoesterase [Xylanimonas protaetiae]